MRTRYRIDDFQQTYFVIDSFEELLHKTAERDFNPVYDRLRELDDLMPDALTPEDEIIHCGTQRYARKRA